MQGSGLRLTETLCLCQHFVNPLQFNEQQDLGSYPVTPDQDVKLLKQIGYRAQDIQ